MAIKKYGPTTPGRRGMTVTDYSVLSNVTLSAACWSR
jgi:large subunit ribosomal protein L2